MPPTPTPARSSAPEQTCGRPPSLGRQCGRRCDCACGRHGCSRGDKPRTSGMLFPPGQTGAMNQRSATSPDHSCLSRDALIVRAVHQRCPPIGNFRRRHVDVRATGSMSAQSESRRSLRVSVLLAQSSRHGPRYVAARRLIPDMSRVVRLDRPRDGSCRNASSDPESQSFPAAARVGQMAVIPNTSLAII